MLVPFERLLWLNVGAIFRVAAHGKLVVSSIVCSQNTVEDLKVEKFDESESNQILRVNFT